MPPGSPWNDGALPPIRGGAAYTPTLHGTQQLMTAVGMGVVALGAGTALARRRTPYSRSS